MNGILWKWTNYYNGWQQRWFILKDGVLSYYSSENEISSGCKGSLNLSVCDINVFNDSLRFDLIIPNEQKYSLKALNTHDRQRWIVAIGSCKIANQNEVNLVNEIDKDFKYNLNRNKSVTYVDFAELNDEMNAKESEMRIFQQLISQQINIIKSNLKENEPVSDFNVVNEASSTLNAACDTFLSTMQDIMLLTSTIKHNSFEIITSGDTSPTVLPRSSNNISRKQLSMSHHHQQQDQLDKLQLAKNIQMRRPINFFYQMNRSFVDLDVTAISTDYYVECSRDLLGLLGCLQSYSCFKTITTDIEAVLKRLSLIYQTDPNGCSTIQNILAKEPVLRNVGDPPINSTLATIRFINRYLCFSETLINLILNAFESIEPQTEPSVSQQADGFNILVESVTKAYESTLKEKLNWIDRGLFSVIVKCLPTPNQFISMLLLTNTDSHDDKDDELPWQQYFIRSDCLVTKQLLIDMHKFHLALHQINKEISQLLTNYNHMDL